MKAPQAHRLLLREGRRLWAEAARADGHEPEDLVVRLSPGNPYRRDLDLVIAQAAILGFRFEIIQLLRKTKTRRRIFGTIRGRSVQTGKP